MPELYRLAESMHKSNLIEGVFVMASAASFEHARIQGFLLTTHFTNFVNTKPSYPSREIPAYRLNEYNVYQPDVSFLSREHLHLAGEVHLEQTT